MEKVLLQEMSWYEVKQVLEVTDLAIVPLGANEVYGKHLPLGSDTIVATELAVRVAKKVGAIVTPPIAIGDSSSLRDFPGTLTTSLSVLTAYLKDCCESLIRHKFRRFFIVCGHLGNIPAVNSVASDLYEHALFSMVDVWRYMARQAKGIVETDCFPEGHASEVGTSVLLALRPDLVNMALATREVPPSKWILSPDLRHLTIFGELTESGVIGDPTRSSAQKGEEILKKAINELSEFVGKFKQMDLRTPQPIQPKR
ncbi:MAG: creatininase family protein [Deltaproteobacteria bacterium]|nr:creatininase family protein [Deltaproteobacteria bacterium]